MLDAEVITVPADGAYHSLKDLSTRLFGKGLAEFRTYTEFGVTVDQVVYVKLDVETSDAAEFMLGGSMPSSVSFAEDFDVDASDISIKVVGGIPAIVQVLGTGILK